MIEDLDKPKDSIRVTVLHFHMHEDPPESSRKLKAPRWSTDLGMPMPDHGRATNGHRVKDSTLTLATWFQACRLVEVAR